MARTRKDNSSPLFKTFCEFYDEFAFTHKMLLMVELAGRIYYGYIRIDLNWLLTYCYLGKASNGLPKLRIKPTNKQKAALIRMNGRITLTPISITPTSQTSKSRRGMTAQ